ncbi:glycoside hydrolase family 6 protein [Tulasnella calospora MUT 4182]|uniref:Glucanase n=1 Tax=Tulasnella calospora MUT 4182 TaxID=1051891 RepID=A0A0C3QB25_9AGAM|nr:glycoside hydrolase family 6 protein [Tulasnella calospora MUT 4182]
MKYSIASLITLAWTVTTVNAAVPVWGQCGGLNYTGDKTCAAGSTCVYSNDWYSQCLPGTATTTTTTTTTRTSTTSTRTSTTTSTNTSTSRTSSTSTTRTSSTSTTSTATPSGTCGTFGNPYESGYTTYLSPFYVAEVNAAIANASSPALAAKFPAVAQIPNFTWFDVVAKVPTLNTYLADAASIASKIIVQIVVYDLPDRDCHALASNGEFKIANNGVNNYKGYIDGIAAAVSAYPQVRVVAVVEPDSLANLVTNLSDQRCANAQSAYLECTKYAIEKLRQCNIWLYLDAGHAGWLGWASNQDPAAQMFAQVYSGVPNNRVRGLATNVANYNALQAVSPDPVTQGNPTVDELSYIRAIGPKLASRGFPAKFLVDQGRSGVQNIRDAWGNWCNIEGAGFGLRPTTNTPDALIDAIVWIKPGGEADGTSDTSAVRYDATCGLNDAKKPAPEAGQWFQAYFEDLVKYANPAF